MAPIGYGEMAPRDIEATMFGSVLMKPDMSYIDSEPFIYEDNKTYISVNYDWSNLEEKIDYVLSDYKNVRERLVSNMRKKYEESYDLKNLVIHLYDIIKNLDGVGVS
jgi:glycosyltransferase involved in cell wall biosynthesis